MKKYINIALTAASILSSAGCVAEKDEKIFGQKISEANAALTSNLTYAHRVQLEFKTTYESRLFLSRTPRRTEQKADCSTNYEREIKIAELRIAKFKIVDIFFKKMESEFSNNIDFTKYVAEFDTAASTIESVKIPGFSTAAEIAIIKAIAGPAARLANQLQARWDLQRISEIARKIEKPLSDVIQDITTGLVTSQENLNAAVKAWETCEYERLEVIYSHENANPVEVSTLFETFQIKLASLKAQNKIVISSKGALDGVVTANKKLANPTMSVEEAKSYLEEGAKALKEFKAIVDQLDKL